MRDPAPAAIVAPCPDCGEETLHTVLRGGMGAKGARITIEGTVRCNECARVHHAVVREPAPVDLPAIVSRGAGSSRKTVNLGGQEVVRLDDELLVEGERCVVTGIEDRAGRRVPIGAAGDIQTLWLKWFEELDIPVSVNLRTKTASHLVRVPPEQDLNIGDEIVIGKLRVIVHSMKTAAGPVRSGSRPAKVVQRIYAKPWKPDVKHPAKAARDRARFKVMEVRRKEREERARRQQGPDR